jgi:hypothetical protein
MSYKYIAIRGRTEPLDTVLSEAYAQGVQFETRLANAAPDLLLACRTVDALLALASASGRPPESRQMLIESAQGILRGAIERATGTEVQS